MQLKAKRFKRLCVNVASGPRNAMVNSLARFEPTLSRGKRLQSLFHRGPRSRSDLFSTWFLLAAVNAARGVFEFGISSTIWRLFSKHTILIGAVNCTSSVTTSWPSYQLFGSSFRSALSRLRADCRWNGNFRSSESSRI
jgi:hypothetical protein